MTAASTATSLAQPARVAGQASSGVVPGQAADLFALLLAGLFGKAQAGSPVPGTGDQLGQGSPGASDLLRHHAGRVLGAAEHAQRSPGDDAAISFLPESLPRAWHLPGGGGSRAPETGAREGPDGGLPGTDTASLLALLPASPPPSEPGQPAADAPARVADGEIAAPAPGTLRTPPPGPKNPSSGTVPPVDGSPQARGEGTAGTLPVPWTRASSSAALGHTEGPGDTPFGPPDQPAGPNAVRAEATRIPMASPREGIAALLASTGAASGARGQQQVGEAGKSRAADARSVGLVETFEAATSRGERASPEAPAPAARPQPAAPVVQIGHQILRAATHRVERMTVQLEPAALGRVDIRLDFSHEGRVSALIATDRPDTLDMLQRDARTLERSLEQAGLRLDSGGLGFALKRDGGHGQPSAGPAWSEPAGDGTREQPGEDGRGRDARPAITAMRLLDLQV